MPDIKPFAAALSEMKKAGTSLTTSDWSSIYVMMEKLNGKADELKSSRKIQKNIVQKRGSGNA
jgi:hypothetical protein